MIVSRRPALAPGRVRRRGTDRDPVTDAAARARDPAWAPRRGSQVPLSFRDRICAPDVDCGFGHRLGFRIGPGFRVNHRGVHRLVIVQRNVAVAAIAAAAALLAEMIGAGVLGAADTDPQRFFFTDTTGEWHFPFTFLRAAEAPECPGWRAPSGSAALRDP